MDTNIKKESIGFLITDYNSGIPELWRIITKNWKRRIKSLRKYYKAEDNFGFCEKLGNFAENEEIESWGQINTRIFLKENPLTKMDEYIFDDVDDNFITKKIVVVDNFIQY